MIILRRGGSQILLESAFDTKADDYSNTYAVFELPNISEDDLDGSWECLSSKATRFLGQVSVQDVRFDLTLRREIGTDFLDELLRNTSRD
jgi:hypothetical protein